MKKVELEEIEVLICPNCKEIVSNCDKCMDYLTIDNSVYCCEGFEHLCEECYKDKKQGGEDEELVL